MTKAPAIRTILMLAALNVAMGCSGPTPDPAPASTETAEETHDHDADHDHDHDHDHHHHHAPPHGGTLVSLGDHVAHLEIAHDADTGTLTLYVLDGEAENPVRLKDAQIKISIADGEEEALALSLLPVANALTGETVGDSSQFEVKDPRLVGREQISGTIPSITVMGVTSTELAIVHPGESE